MTIRFCRSCRDWHDLSQPWPEACMPKEPARSHLPRPYLISDALPDVQSMATGKFYDSKSALRAEYRAVGATEMGNDKPEPKIPSVDRKGIRTSLQKAKARLSA